MWGSIIKGIGTAYSIYSSYQSSKDAKDTGKANSKEIKRAAAENAKLSLYDAAVMDRAAREEYFVMSVNLKRHVEAVDAFMGTQRAKYGKSGVTLDTGTPLVVEADTARKGEMDRQMIRYEGQKAVRQRKEAANRYRKLADAGLRDAAAHAAIIRDTASATSKAYQMQGISKTISGTYDIGEDFGWWG